MSAKIIRTLENESETIKFGIALSTLLRPGDIVKITGLLGAGKTTLVRGIVEGLGGDSSQVHSPTFSLVHEYQAPSLDIFHCDFYRLPEGSTLEEFGGLEFFSEDNCYLVEWPERIKLFESDIPNRLLGVDLRIDDHRREVTLTGEWDIVDQNIFAC